jgi:hypothetical protein
MRTDAVWCYSQARVPDLLPPTDNLTETSRQIHPSRLQQLSGTISRRSCRLNLSGGMTSALRSVALLRRFDSHAHRFTGRSVRSD